MLAPDYLLIHFIALIISSFWISFSFSTSISKEDFGQKISNHGNEIKRVKIKAIQASDNDFKHQLHSLNKRRFYQWAGKRGGKASDTEEHRDNQLKPGFNTLFRTREPDFSGESKTLKRGFYQWSGKKRELSEIVSLRNDTPKHLKDDSRFESRSEKKYLAGSAKSDDLPDYDKDKKGFYPWSGKRGTSQIFKNTDFGGKFSKDKKFTSEERAIVTGKRGFYQWSGKRVNMNNDGDVGDSRVISASNERQGLNHLNENLKNKKDKEIIDTDAQKFSLAKAEKRGFYQWSGKRAINTDGGDIMANDPQIDLLTNKKRAFYQWSGKRANKKDKEEVDTDPQHYSSANEKRGFYQWSGKRNSNKDDDVNNANPQRNQVANQKRGFYQWSGKRNSKNNDGIDADPQKSTMTNQKQANQQWKVQRVNIKDYEIIDSDLHKNSIVNQKRGFYQWGGKKSYSEDSQEIISGQKIPQEFANNSDKRGFYQWSGKRSPQNITNDLIRDSTQVKTNVGPNRNQEDSKSSGKQIVPAKNPNNIAGSVRDKEVMFDPKRGFYQWGGKRTSEKSDSRLQNF